MKIKENKSSPPSSILTFTLKHVSEMRMEKADRLSKKLNWKVKVEKDNENQVVVKED